MDSLRSNEQVARRVSEGVLRTTFVLATVRQHRGLNRRGEDGGEVWRAVYSESMLVLASFLADAAGYLRLAALGLSRLKPAEAG